MSLLKGLLRVASSAVEGAIIHTAQSQVQAEQVKTQRAAAKAAAAAAASGQKPRRKRGGPPEGCTPCAAKHAGAAMANKLWAGMKR